MRKKLCQVVLLQASHNTIIRISGSLNIVSEHFHIMNTNGIDYTDASTFISGTINANSEVSNLPVSGIGAICSRTLGSFSAHGVGNDSKNILQWSSLPSITPSIKVGKVSVTSL